MHIFAHAVPTGVCMKMYMTRKSAEPELVRRMCMKEQGRAWKSKKEQEGARRRRKNMKEWEGAEGEEGEEGEEGGGRYGKRSAEDM